MKRFLPTSAYPALAALAIVTLLSGPAGADSPRGNMFELHVGPYAPAIDDQFDGATPYADTFGSGSMWLWGLHVDRQVWQGFGSLAVGGGLRYGFNDGKAKAADGSDAEDETTLHLMPLTLSAVYRFDVGAVRWGVPLVPYAKAGLSYGVWWITNGKDEIANAYDTKSQGHVGTGGTMGMHFALGVQLLLDWIDTAGAAELDTDAGVNNSYLFGEWMTSSMNDFGSAESLELSDSGAFSFGLMFEF